MADVRNVCDITVRYKSEEHRSSDLKAVVKRLVDGWSAAVESDMKIVVIQGGITNLLYRVDYNGKSALVRVFGAKTELMIDREVDNRVFQGLSDRKFGPFLHGAFANGRVEGWFDASPLEPEDMGKTAPLNIQKLIAEGLQRMHSLDMPGDKIPGLWVTLTKWEKMAAGVSFEAGRLADGTVALNRRKLAQEMAWIKTVLPSDLNNHGADLTSSSRAVLDFVSESVFCHNDLLSGNILKLNGQDALQFLDFEYGGFNYRGFDIANHFCEYAGFDFDLDRWYPTRASQSEFLAAYIARQGKAADAGFLNELSDFVNKFALASHFFWGLWAIIQARHSPIDFDFMGYALQRFRGYYKHKAAFFAANFSESDARAEKILVKQIEVNDEQLGEAGDAGESKGSDEEEAKTCPHAAKAAEGKTCPHAAKAAEGKTCPHAAKAAEGKTCPHAAKAAEGKTCPHAAKAAEGKTCPHAAKAAEGKKCPFSGATKKEGSCCKKSEAKCPVGNAGKYIGVGLVVGALVVAGIIIARRR